MIHIRRAEDCVDIGDLNNRDHVSVQGNEQIPSSTNPCVEDSTRQHQTQQSVSILSQAPQWYSPISNNEQIHIPPSGNEVKHNKRCMVKKGDLKLACSYDAVVDMNFKDAANYYVEVICIHSYLINRITITSEHGKTARNM